jgi:hypothetical protein
MNGRLLLLRARCDSIGPASAEGVSDRPRLQHLGEGDLRTVSMCLYDRLLFSLGTYGGEKLEKGSSAPIASLESSSGTLERICRFKDSKPESWDTVSGVELYR